MSLPELKRRSLASIAVDFVICGLIWLFFFCKLPPYVPSSDPFWVHFWAGVTAVSLTTVFWLAIQMFRVVLAFQRSQSQARSHK